MTSSPEEIVESVIAQWPCRDEQVDLLTYLLRADTPSPSNIIIHGPRATEKSTILNAVLTSNPSQNAAPPNSQIGQRKRKRESLPPRPPPADGSRFPHAIVKCAECVTARHLLVKLVSRTISALASLLRTDSKFDADTWAAEMHVKAKCDHISQLPDAMRLILEESAVFSRLRAVQGEPSATKFVLVLDGVDNIREGGPALLAGFARTAQLTPSLTFVYVSRQSPRPFLLQTAGVPHIYFPPYDRDECIKILTRRKPDLSFLVDAGFEEGYADEIYTSYLGLIYDVLIGPTASILPMFRNVAEKLWPYFIEPISTGEKPPGFGIDEEWSPRDWDFSRLVIRNRALLREQGEALLVHHIIPDVKMQPSNGEKKNDTRKPTNGVDKKSTSSSSSLPQFPYLPTLLLASAFLAAHIPPRLDLVFFSKYASSSTKTKRRIQRRHLKPASSASDKTPSKSTTATADIDLDDTGATPSKKRNRSTTTSTTKLTKSSIESTLLSTSSSSSAPGVIQARPFTLERLFAIFHAVASNSTADPHLPSKSLADAVFAEIATLQRLRLLVPK
ncbi:hypothetical protein KEM56_005916 [Ascosphaera pollenicola]|nr:hypothetical protein KEM56_005916 [Ascosphaera pollenicola]